MDHQYNIGKVTYYQDELNWQQDKQLTKLFKTALNSMENDTLTIDNALEILLKYDLLDAFFTIILKPKKDFWYYLNICKNVALFPFRRRWQNVPFETLKNSELRQIINDFFTQQLVVETVERLRRKYNIDERQFKRQSGEIDDRAEIFAFFGDESEPIIDELIEARIFENYAANGNAAALAALKNMKVTQVFALAFHNLANDLWQSQLTN